MGILIPLFIILLAIWFGGEFLPLWVVKEFLHISLLLKEILCWVLPWVIVTYISTAIISMRQKSYGMILILLSLVCASNAFAAFLSYGLAGIILPTLSIDVINLSTPNDFNITPWIKLTPLFPSDKAMLLGFFVGIVSRIVQKTWLNNLLIGIKDRLNWGLRNLFIPCLPLYIAGFALKMQHEGGLETLLLCYGKILLILVSITWIYLLAVYFLIQPKKLFINIKNMLPAGLTGFATMSSVMSLPVAIEGVKKNGVLEEVAHLSLPTTINNHLLGDAIGVPFIALSLLFATGNGFPEFSLYCNFVFYFVLAKFSTAAIPGGGIIIMIPVLQQYLGFTPELSSIMTLIYILQDPLLTSSNVMGNGALAMLYQKIYNFNLFNKRIPDVC